MADVWRDASRTATAVLASAVPSAKEPDVRLVGADAVSPLSFPPDPPSQQIPLSAILKDSEDRPF